MTNPLEVGTRGSAWSLAKETRRGAAPALSTRLILSQIGFCKERKGERDEAKIQEKKDNELGVEGKNEDNEKRTPSFNDRAGSRACTGRENEREQTLFLYAAHMQCRA